MFSLSSSLRRSLPSVGCSILLFPFLAHAAQTSDFYLREEIPLPPGEVMEIGSIALMPEQKIAVTTRRGDLWICSGAYADDLTKVTWKKFAQNLHEPLGMFWKDGSLFLTQRPEVTKITDADNDGLADTFETICSDWGISGDYHEYAFGSEPDKNGDIWIVLCLTGSSRCRLRLARLGVRVTPDGKMIPTAPASARQAASDSIASATFSIPTTKASGTARPRSNGSNPAPSKAIPPATNSTNSPISPPRPMSPTNPAF